MVLVRMKEQIDHVEEALKERTTELREVKSFVQRLQIAIEDKMQKMFDHTFKQIDYHVADLNDHIKQRMDIVGGKMVKNNKKIEQTKDFAAQDNTATKKRVKVFGRKVDARMDEVSKDHDKLSHKYDFLIHCNDYFGQLAEQMITITELNSCLMRADERDKDSICMLGTQGPKTIQG